MASGNLAIWEWLSQWNRQDIWAGSKEFLDRLDAVVDQPERPALGAGKLGRRVDPQPVVDRRGDLGGA